ncbi:MAG TPA: hypothetical protein VIL18_06235 [Longimicrobiales bacterium]
MLLPLVVVVLLGSIVLEVRRQRSPARPPAELRTGLMHARAAADSCAAALAAEEEDFRAFGARVDSMREVVRGFEALDPAGVPVDSYAHYLAAVDTYNAAAAAWPARADSLRAHWAACRDATEQYNALVDSVRRLMRWDADAQSE